MVGINLVRVSKRGYWHQAGSYGKMEQNGSIYNVPGISYVYSINKTGAELYMSKNWDPQSEPENQIV